MDFWWILDGCLNNCFLFAWFPMICHLNVDGFLFMDSSIYIYIYIYYVLYVIYSCTIDGPLMDPLNNWWTPDGPLMDPWWTLGGHLMDPRTIDVPVMEHWWPLDGPDVHLMDPWWALEPFMEPWCTFDGPLMDTIRKRWRVQGKTFEVRWQGKHYTNTLFTGMTF